MPNYTITNADLSREERIENYDGTAAVNFYDSEGILISTETVPSDETPPAVDVIVADPDALATAASAGQEAQSVEDLRAAFILLLNAIGVQNG